MGTHLRVLSDSYPMSTNMTGLIYLSINLCVLVLWAKVASACIGLNAMPCALDENNLSIGRVKDSFKKVGRSLPVC